MQSERDGLVPIGDALSDLGRPVKAVGEASPQALGHFTLSDQVDQLAWAGEEDPDLGFMARPMALCSLPRTNPGNQHQYKRQNGPYKLIMVAGGDNKLPFGNLPRLLLAWVSTEAVRTQSRELILGRSLSEFMRSLGINSDSGGARGEQTRLRNQMNRLFSATVSLIYDDKSGFKRVSSLVADKHEFWWDPKRPDDPSLWDSKIRLGEAFFQEIIQHPVPLDMNTLMALKRSSLGIVKLRLTAVFDAQHGGFETGWSPISWGSIDELFVNLTMPPRTPSGCSLPSIPETSSLEPAPPAGS